jgi:restriction endonuclease S subunit
LLVIYVSFIGNIADVSRGKGTKSIDYTKEGIPFIRTTSLTNFSIDPFPDHYASNETYINYKQPVMEGDILYSIEGKIGMLSYILKGQKCVYKNHIERIRCKYKDPIFIFLFLNTKVAKAQANRNTVVQATLPGMASRLREIRVPLEKRTGPERYSKVIDCIVEDAKKAFEKKADAVSNWHWANQFLRESLSSQ